MNTTEQTYKNAWERIKIGKAKIVDKSLPINSLNTVALEAGRKKGSLRRIQYPDLCNDIISYEIKETPLQKANRQKEEYKKVSEEKDRLWKDGLGKELMLNKRIIELEMEIKRIKQRYGIVFELDDLL